MKKIVAAILIVCMLSIPITSFAAPEKISSSDAGTSSNLIIMKKPETSISSTTKKNYTLSGVSIMGAEVSLYSYNKETGYFDLKKNSDGSPLTVSIGASGIYLQEVDLTKETNYLLVHVENGAGNYQNVRLDITLLNQALLDSIKGFAANFKSLFGGW